jgi:hypothetical protein
VSKKARRKKKSHSGWTPSPSPRKSEEDPKDEKTASPESDELWAEMLSAWREDPRSIPRVKGSSWYGPRYSHCLADYPGDPSAIVSSPREAMEVAKRKGLIAPFTEVEIDN